MSFGLTFEKLLLIAVIAAFVIGPDRLPIFSAKLAQLVRSLKGIADGAKERVREEMGPEFDEVEWKKLDPRQYDPRRILRDAMLEESRTDAPTPRHTPALTRSDHPAGRQASKAETDQAAG